MAWNPIEINGYVPYPFYHLHPMIDLRYPPELNKPLTVIGGSSGAQYEFFFLFSETKRKLILFP